MAETSNSETVSTRQRRIAELAKQSPEMGFTSLNHHLDLEWMREAFRRTRKDGAPGVDGQTAAEYEADLANNLQRLLDRAKSGTYRAPAVRRVEIPKGDGRTRPIGIPTFEDKVLQRAIAMLLEPIYEQDFLDCSWGFRPGRSQHGALDVIRETIMPGGGWIIDGDIQQFFDTLDHGHLRELLHKRVRDGVVKRLIGKWLKAGVMEEGKLRYPDEGTPQGGVISPLLANVYLHYVLDRWFHEEARPLLTGRATLVRFADDFIIALSDRRDAERVLEVLPKRMGRFGLTIHPEKTRLVPFRRPRRDQSGRGKGNGDGPRPGSFDFLGFTHYWCRSRRGHWVVKRKTMSSRLQRALRKVREWCRQARHEPIAVQHARLSRMVHGHCAYYGITGNSAMLSQYHRQVQNIWYTWLRRRSRQRDLTWERFKRGILARFPLPPPIAVHSTYRHVANA